MAGSFTLLTDLHNTIHFMRQMVNSPSFFVEFLEKDKQTKTHYLSRIKLKQRRINTKSASAKLFIFAGCPFVCARIGGVPPGPPLTRSYSPLLALSSSPPVEM